MERQINWIRVILIMGLAFALVSVHFVLTAYSLFYSDSGSLVDIMAKKGVVESVIGLLLFLIVVKNTTREDIKKGLRGLTLYIVVVTLFLVLGVALGIVMQHALPGMFEELFEGLAKEAERFQSLSSPQQTIFIFGNNLRVAIISGIVAFFPGLGVLLPLSIMGLNGTVIGMAPAVFEIDYSMFFLAILPHGILEIPALILASAVGVKFSVCSLKAAIGYLFASRGVSRREVFLREIKPGWHAVKLFAVIIPMLAAAAIIEVFVSTWIVEVLGI